MSPPLFHVMRAIVVALVGALSTVIVATFDDLCGEDKHHPPPGYPHDEDF